MESPSEIHAEDRELVEKLARLQNIHQQINDLRGLLPNSLLKSTKVVFKNPRELSPAKLAADIRQAASEGIRDIQRFKKDFQSPEMRDLWQKTNAAEFDQGRDSWIVDYEALTKASSTDSKAVDVPVASNQQVDTSTSEDEEAVVKRFQNIEPALKIARASPSTLYPLDVRVGKMSFRLVKEEQDGKQEFTIEPNAATSSSDLHNEVIKNVKQRKDRSSLESLLSMLVSYQDLKFKSCDRCQNIFDDMMRYALVRHRKPAASKESTGITWEVLHQGCAS